MPYFFSFWCLFTAVIAITINSAAAGTPVTVTIDAAFLRDRNIVLFANDKALFIDKNTKTEFKVTDRNNWVIKVPDDLNLQAALESGTYVFYVNYFGDNIAYKFDLGQTKRKLETFRYKNEFLSNGGPDAAARRHSTRYFFKGCQMVAVHRGNHWGTPENVEDFGLPCNPDAAWPEWPRRDNIVVLKGSLIWLWKADGSVEGPHPFADHYTIYSWKLRD